MPARADAEDPAAPPAPAPELAARRAPADGAGATAELTRGPDTAPAPTGTDPFGVAAPDVAGYLLGLWGLPDEITGALRGWDHQVGVVDAGLFHQRGPARRPFLMQMMPVGWLSPLVCGLGSSSRVRRRGRDSNPR